METFVKWVKRLAQEQQLSIEEVASWALIPTRRWAKLMNSYPPTNEEAEAVATEAFGMFPEEAYTSPHSSLATKFRGFLGPREAYRLPRLFPKVLVTFSFRTDRDSAADARYLAAAEIFRSVLESDTSDAPWANR